VWLRRVAPVVLVLGLAVAGFFGTRLHGEHDARLDSERQAEVAAVQIRGRVEQGASLAESLRQLIESMTGSQFPGVEFRSNASRWLIPAGFSAAAWVERVPAPQRAAYQRRAGNPIVTRDRHFAMVPAGPRPEYLPATFVSGVPPMEVPGTDLSGEPGLAAAVARASAVYDVIATPLATLQDGTRGLFLVRFAPLSAGRVTEPGFVVLFVSADLLRAAAAGAGPLRLTVGGGSAGDLGGAAAVHDTFTEAGRRFDVAVPLESAAGAAILPWIILAAGLALAALAGALGVNGARRARAQRELDRIFNLSSDLIAVADFEGHFTRVNPAVEQILGYTGEEFLARPYLEFVHPDDREKTTAAASRIRQGKKITSFETRYAARDGSYRVLEWTSIPVLDEGLTYAVARDVTERRQAEGELRRLAGELAASRRRIVTASDQTRRRIERDLHDGTQQQLVSLVLAARGAAMAVPPDRDDLRAELSRIATGLADAVAELREITRGIHPAILSQGGLGPALRMLARRSAIPIDLRVTTDTRLSEPIEVAVYYVASEALANAAKHGQASRMDISLATGNESLLLSIRDDGVGGADPGRGSGLVGLHDRVEALGGTIMIDSPPGGGTSLVVTLPLEDGAKEDLLSERMMSGGGQSRSTGSLQAVPAAAGQDGT
jgi:PAS domain S-box-containing protein